MSITAAHTTDDPEASPPRPRWAFLGDSHTDGFIWPEFVLQTLRQQGLADPIMINAAVAGNTTAQMLDRLDRDVLAYQPDLVFFQGGGNDLAHQIDDTIIQANAHAIMQRCKDAGVDVIVINVRRASFGRVPNDLGFPVADAARLIKIAQNDAGPDPLLWDQTHLSERGHRLVARAVLDTLGHQGEPLPAKIDIKPYPGLIDTWTVHPLNQPDLAKTITVPMTRPHPDWWMEFERKRGMVVGLNLLFPKQPAFHAKAELRADEPRQAFLNTGGTIHRVHLNGELIYASQGFEGFHPGTKRLPVSLKQGKNTIALECGYDFFISVTDLPVW